MNSMSAINVVPLTVAQSMASVGSFIYMGKCYDEVSLTSPVFSHPLYENEIENVEDISDITLPSALEPVKLIRMYHPRIVIPLVYKKNGEIVESVSSVQLSRYVPYDWVPVRFEHNNEIKWYKHSM